MERIDANAAILLDMLRLLEGRPELTDGSMYIAVSAKRIAGAVVAQTSRAIGLMRSTTPPAWTESAEQLRSLDQLTVMVQSRSDGVRRYHGLNASTSAQQIRDKYLPLAEAIKASRVADDGGPVVDITTTYY